MLQNRLLFAGSHLAWLVHSSWTDPSLSFLPSSPILILSWPNQCVCYIPHLSLLSKIKPLRALLPTSSPLFVPPLTRPEIMVAQASDTSAPHSNHFGPSSPPLPSLVLPLRPQHPAAILILLWAPAGTPRSRSISHWLSVRSVRPGWLGEAEPAPPGCWEEMVRKMWLRLRRNSPPVAPRPKLLLRRTMRVLADLAGRDLWLYSSWDRWEA